MNRITIALLLAAGLLVSMPATSQAIPAFARKYGFNCNMCHTAYPNLNDFGQRFRQNGYQIPGQQGGEKTVFEIAPPIAIRTTFGLEAAHTKRADSYGFNLFGLDLLSAGVMHKNMSHLVIYTPRLDEPSTDFNGNEPSQSGALESANLVFSNLLADGLNLRVGRFEPAYHDISSKRSYYLAQPYEIYTFTTPASTFVFDDNQMGLEMTAILRGGLRCAAGVINGNGANPDNNKPKDLYLTVNQVFGRGEGQSAGQRIGTFGYVGWQPTKFPEEEGAVGNGNHSIFRVGGNTSLNWRTWHLSALVMYGTDDERLNPLRPDKSYDFTGGFAELDYAGLWNNRLVASALFNWVQPPEYDDQRQVRAFSALARYYLGDWTAVNVALHCEYTHREIGADDPIKQDNLTLRVDFGF